MDYFLIYKPFGVHSQFKPDGEKPGLGTLHDFPKDVYPVGRLDADSEGLLLLTNDTAINKRLLHPRFKHHRTYLIQVEGTITQEAIDKLLDPDFYHSIKSKAYEARSMDAADKIVEGCVALSNKA